MKNKTKILGTAAAFIASIACTLFAGCGKLAGYVKNLETNTYEIGESFESISVETGTANIIFELSDDGKCRVECREAEKARHSVSVEEGVLKIEPVDKSATYFGIHIPLPMITVYLPEKEYASLDVDVSTGNIEIPKDLTFYDIDISASTGDVNLFANVSGTVKVKTSTGQINVENIRAHSLDLKVTTGAATVSGATLSEDAKIDVKTGKTLLTDVACKNVISNGSTGGICLKNVIASEKFTIERKSGDVEFDRSDASDIYVETKTGDVKGSLLSEKIFIVQTGTGSVNVPQTAGGGRCEITTGTGSIHITIA